MPSEPQRSDRIFISYRRDDTQGYAGRLEDSLAAYFGPERVFRDVRSIEAGADFSEVVKQELGEAGAVIVLIGEQWLTATLDGRERLGEDEDHVTLEVATALKREIPVIPVLVESADMPREGELPDSLKSLARRNAFPISDSRWNEDVTRLAKILAIDVPGSVAEMKLDRLVSGALVTLLAALFLSVSTFAWAAYVSARTHVDHNRGLELQAMAVTKDDIFVLNSFTAAVPSVSLFLVGGACALLMIAARYAEPSTLRPLHLAISTAISCMVGCLAVYGLVDNPGDVIALFALSMIAIGLMLGFLSRFRLKGS